MSKKPFLDTAAAMMRPVRRATIGAVGAAWRFRKPLLVVAPLALTGCANALVGMTGLGPSGDGSTSQQGGPYYDPTGRYARNQGGLLTDEQRQALEGYAALPRYGFGADSFVRGQVIREYRCHDRTGFFPNAFLGPECRPTGRTTVIQSVPGYAAPGYVQGGEVISEYQCKDRTGFFANALLGQNCRRTGRTMTIQRYGY